MKKQDIRMIECDKDIWAILMNIGISSCKENINSGNDDLKNDFANIGLETVLKYYLLNIIVKKWEIDLDPASDLKTLLEKIHETIVLRALKQDGDPMEYYIDFFMGDLNNK